MVNERKSGFAPIFPDTCYHLTYYWPAAADIPVASDNPAHYADAIRYNARTPLQGSLLPLTVWFGHDTDVITLYRFHEALCYAVTLRTPHRRVLRFKPQHPGKLPCFISPVA